MEMHDYKLCPFPLEQIYSSVYIFKKSSKHTDTLCSLAVGIIYTKALKQNTVSSTHIQVF